MVLDVFPRMPANPQVSIEQFSQTEIVLTP